MRVAQRLAGKTLWRGIHVSKKEEKQEATKDAKDEKKKPEEAEGQEEGQEAASEEAPKKSRFKIKLTGPILFAILGVGVFVLAVGAFSFMMGLFNNPETPVQAPTGGDTLGQVAKVEQDSLGHSLDSLSPDSARDSSYINKLRQAENMDEIVTMAKKADSTQAVKDSLTEVASIDEGRAQLAKERSELEARKKELDEKEKRVQQLLAKVGEIETGRINSLVKLYDGMKSAQVAPLISQLTDEQAVQILMKMKPANAAKVMGELNPALAARISAKMITLSEEQL